MLVQRYSTYDSLVCLMELLFQAQDLHLALSLPAVLGIVPSLQFCCIPFSLLNSPNSEDTYGFTLDFDLALYHFQTFTTYSSHLCQPQQQSPNTIAHRLFISSVFTVFDHCILSAKLSSQCSTCLSGFNDCFNGCTASLYQIKNWTPPSYVNGVLDLSPKSSFKAAFWGSSQHK